MRSGGSRTRPLGGGVTCARWASQAATAQPIQQVALGFGSVSRGCAREVDGTLLDNPVASGRLLDGQWL
jgi:hypothetical protein